MKTTGTKKTRRKARGGNLPDFGAKNAAREGAVVKSKRGGKKAAKKKVVKKK